MRLCTLIGAGLLALAGACCTAHAQSTLYWDVNGTDPGAGPDAFGFFDGIWPTDPFWSTDPNGNATPGAWVDGSHAVFMAGDHTESEGIITITGTQNAASLVVEDSVIKLRGGTVNTGAGTVTVRNGATLDIDSTVRLNTNNGAGIPAGDVILQNGTLMQSNIGNAGTFLGTGTNGTTGDGGGLRNLMVDGIGYIGYNDGDGVADNKVSIFYGVIKGREGGVDGTPTNGGRGTLVKIGPDQLGVGVSDQDFVAGAPRVHSQELFSFAKLRVEEGAYRLRHQTQDNTVRETAFGAVPLAELPDAITLDGGGIGSNTTVTLHEFRGVTIGPNGGYFDHGAGASLIIPGPLSGSGALGIGSPTSTAASAPGFTLSHANNVNTFTGDLIGYRGLLTLNSSLRVGSLQDGNTTQNPTNNATINVAAGQTLTVGLGGDSGTWSRPIGGAGGFTKIGAGTQSLTGTPTYSGDTRVEGGILSISNAYLANAADVYLSTGAMFDLNFAGTDTIDQLFFNNVGQAAGTWGAPGTGADNEHAFFSGTGLLLVSMGPGGALTGDHNGDGTVDAADYVHWRKNNSGNAQGYTDWRTHFGESNAGSGGANAAAGVPEPATLALLMLGFAPLVLRRGRC